MDSDRPPLQHRPRTGPSSRDPPLLSGPVRALPPDKDGQLSSPPRRLRSKLPNLLHHPPPPCHLRSLKGPHLASHVLVTRERAAPRGNETPFPDTYYQPRPSVGAAGSGRTNCRLRKDQPMRTFRAICFLALLLCPLVSSADDPVQLPPSCPDCTPHIPPSPPPPPPPPPEPPPPHAECLS